MTILRQESEKGKRNKEYNVRDMGRMDIYIVRIDVESVLKLGPSCIGVAK